MPGKLVWIESHHFLGFGCSQCNWVFRPSGVVGGESLDKMNMDYDHPPSNQFLVPSTVHFLSMLNAETERDLLGFAGEHE
jgi:hypothetical protein